MLSPSNGHDFYLRSMQVLLSDGIPFLVGGAFALRAYSGIVRDTKDFDLMMRREDVDRALPALRAAGYQADIVYPHWLAKVHHGTSFVDIIYNSGNGVCPVDDQWFDHAPVATAFGEEIRLCPPEEMIWQKAYIMERERFDGADIVHLVRACEGDLDWRRLFRRFGSHAAVLHAHLLLVRFIYPAEASLVPEWVLEELAAADRADRESGAPKHLCNGPLLSRAQYLTDVERWDYEDARLEPRGGMTEADLRRWTSAIDQGGA